MRPDGKVSAMHQPVRMLDSDGVATLKQLALVGALDGGAKLSCGDLAERLDASTQTASRRLQRLESEGFIDREVESDGQWVEFTDEGTRHLQAEYAAYRRIFEGETGIDLHGTVTSGMGEGRHYISLDGYMEQFRNLLGYEPFAGTLNVDLTEESVRRRTRLAASDPITIEGWESEDRTYGPAYCFPASIETTDGMTEENVHVIAPERTHHGDDHLEVIAPVKLRDELDLADGDTVTITVEGA